MRTEYHEGFFDGLWDGRCENAYNPQDTNGNYTEGYFDGYAQGREDAADRGPWSPRLGTSREQDSHAWESLEVTELHNNVDEVAEICECGAKRKTLAMHDGNNTWMKSYTFETEPDPLPNCPR